MSAPDVAMHTGRSVGRCPLAQLNPWLAGVSWSPFLRDTILINLLVKLCFSTSPGTASPIRRRCQRTLSRPTSAHSSGTRFGLLISLARASDHIPDQPARSQDGAGTFHRAAFNQSANRSWDSFVVYGAGTAGVWGHDFGTYHETIPGQYRNGAKATNTSVRK